MDKTRVTLIDKLKNPEDSSAWQDFHDLYGNLIIGWARRLGASHALAQDILQESMITLLRLMQTFEYDTQRGSFRSFLKTISRRRTIDAFRREGKYITINEEENNILEEDDSIHSDSSEMDNVWLRGVLAKALKQAFGKIDQNTYKAFCMYVLDEVPAEEVIRRMNIKRVGTLYQQKSRFLVILKNTFFQLLNDLSNDEFASAPTQIKDTIFNSALEELIIGRKDLRNTMVESNDSLSALKHAESVMDLLKNAQPPNNNKTYLFPCKYGLKQNSKHGSEKWIELNPLVGFKNRVTIGTAESCDLKLDTETVSGLHCSIESTDKGYQLKDENSTNGTMVNGNKLSDTLILKDGDIIQLSSKCKMVFVTAV